MARQRNDLAAGLFILISLALLMGVIIGVKGVGQIVEPLQSVEARFPLDANVGGLRTGADVRLGGARAGSVRSVEIVSPDDADAFVQVSFQLPARFTLKQDAVVRVQEGLTGGAVLNVESLGTGEPLPRGQAIAGAPGSLSQAIGAVSALAPQIGELSTELQTLVAEARRDVMPRTTRLLENATVAVDEVKLAASEGKQLVAEVRAQVPPAVERYNAVADRSAETMTHLRDLLGDTRTDLRSAIASVKGATASLDEKLPGILERVDAVGQSMQQTLADAGTAIEEINRTAVNATEATAAARSLVAGNRGKLDAMIVSLRDTATNLEKASEEIRRSPWRLLYQPKQNELANLNLFDSARAFASGAEAVQQSAAALRDALNDPRVDEQQLRTLLESLQQSFGRFNQAQASLFDQIQD
jgi:ABC-type transporter Mla subunit MlaD